MNEIQNGENTRAVFDDWIGNRSAWIKISFLGVCLASLAFAVAFGLDIVDGMLPRALYWVFAAVNTSFLTYVVWRHRRN